MAATRPQRPTAVRGYLASRVAAVAVAMVLALVVAVDWLDVTSQQETGEAPAAAQMATPVALEAAAQAEGTPSPAAADQAESQERQAAPAAEPPAAAATVTAAAPKTLVEEQARPAAAPPAEVTGRSEAPLLGVEIGLAVVLVTLVGSVAVLRRRAKTM